MFSRHEFRTFRQNHGLKWLLFSKHSVPGTKKPVLVTGFSDLSVLSPRQSVFSVLPVNGLEFTEVDGVLPLVRRPGPR